MTAGIDRVLNICPDVLQRRGHGEDLVAVGVVVAYIQESA